MPDPALEAAHQLLAAGRRGGLEQARNLFPERPGVGPQLLSLGLERTAQGPSVEAYIAGERAASPELDGRSVFGWERDIVASRKSTG